MANWKPLSKQAFADAHYRPRYDYAHTHALKMTPAMLGELTKLLPHYVIAFIETQGVFRPMVLLSVPHSKNVFLKANDQWSAPYVPASLRSHPFSLLHNNNGKAMLAVDTESLQEPDLGVPLFDESGSMTDGVQRAFDFLGKLESQRQRTEKAADTLQAAGIIQPWPLQLTLHGESVKVSGLHRVDEQALNTLTAETYATLQGAPMQLAYAQLYSMAQVDQLTQRAVMQARLGNAQAPENLDAVFGDGDDDLEFDFDS